MIKSKAYLGYKSYQYLDKGIDYKDFTLTHEIQRVSAYVVSVTESEEKRVQKILGESVVISLHDHPTVFPQDMKQVFDYIKEGRQVTAYEGLSVSGLDVVFDNLMGGVKWLDVINNLGMRLCDIAHQDFVIKGTKVADLIMAYNTGKVALVPSLEAATMIENEVDRIDVLYGLGIRMMGIVYSNSNALGSGLKEKRDGGLTYFGRQAIKRMNKLRMAIDLSHASDQTSLDVIKESKSPVVISHAGARKLWNTSRMKPDNVLVACAQKGGLVGISAAPNTAPTKKHPEHNIESYMEHFEYCVDLIGIDHVAFGPDTLFGDHVAFHHAFKELRARKHADIEEPSDVKVKEVQYVKGIENPAEAFPNIVRWLVKHGYSDQEIKKVIGGNILEVLNYIW